ncbi:MAG: hypothetical protein J6Q53_01820 [Oscillospiraceae bacterium]|nr:hypothetical protein [Oscillospiraceae bacterium]
MRKKQKKIIETAAEYGGAAAGAAAGAGIGLVIAGPAGATLGAIAGTALEKAFLHIGKEITERKLSKAENKKVGNVYTLASENIDKKLIAGKNFVKMVSLKKVKLIVLLRKKYSKGLCLLLSAKRKKRNSLIMHGCLQTSPFQQMCLDR